MGLKCSPIAGFNVLLAYYGSIIKRRRDSQEPYRFSIQPLTILGVTGPFSVLAENMYSLCIGSFNVGRVEA